LVPLYPRTKTQFKAAEVAKIPRIKYQVGTRIAQLLGMAIGFGVGLIVLAVGGVIAFWFIGGFHARSIGDLVQILTSIEDRMRGN
jgi:Na+/pantothenate symporter